MGREFDASDLEGGKMEPIRVIQTEELLNQAITEAQKWEGQLGKKTKGRAEKAFEALKAGRFDLGNPQNYIQRLNMDDFESHELELLPEIKKSLREVDGYAFYIVKVPVLLFPGRGAQYRLLESQFTFYAEEDESQPAIQSIFPEPHWKPILDSGVSLDLALDGSLKWGAEVDLDESELGKLGGKLSGRVSNQNKLTGFVKVISLEHNLGQMEIEAQHSDKVAMWRLDSKNAIRRQKQMQFVILIKVPVSIRQLWIEAAAQAEVSFEWLTAEIRHVLIRLSDNIQRIVRKKAGREIPLQKFERWEINLPK